MVPGEGKVKNHDCKEKTRILFVPASRAGEGTGHLRRAVRIASQLSARGYSVSLFANGTSKSGLVPDTISITENLESEWDIMCLDKRRTSPDEVALWNEKGAVIAIDEAGASRQSIHYLLDTLLMPPVRLKPNATALPSEDITLSSCFFPRRLNKIGRASCRERVYCEV